MNAEGTVKALPNPADSHRKASLAVSVFLIVLILAAFWPVTRHKRANYNNRLYS